MNTNRISMNALTPDLKDKLLNGKVLIPAALAAVGAFTFLSAKDVEEIKVNDTPENKENEGYVEFKSNTLFSTADNNLSFSDAFHTQREALGPGGVFEYRNKYYNTYLKEEWDIMTDDQKKDYYASIQKNIDNQSVVHNDMQGNTTSVKIDVTIDAESGDITVSSLTPTVNIASVTVNTGGSKQNDPSSVEPTPDEPSSDEPIADEPTPEEPTPDVPTLDGPREEEEYNIVDPSKIEMEDFDNIDEPSTEMVQEDNITNPYDIEIDDLPDPSLFVIEETDNLQEPVAKNTTQTLVDNAVSLSDDITIDPADFDF